MYLLLKQIVWGIGGIGENEQFVDRFGNGVVVVVIVAVHRPHSSSALLALMYVHILNFDIYTLRW
jgi:hypothetical protein